MGCVGFLPGIHVSAILAGSRPELGMWGDSLNNSSLEDSLVYRVSSSSGSSGVYTSWASSRGVFTESLGEMSDEGRVAEGPASEGSSGDSRGEFAWVGGGGKFLSHGLVFV